VILEIVQILLLAILSVIVTVPAVLFIPRARQSPLFDRILWGATWVLALIGALVTPTYLVGNSMDTWVVAQLPVVSTSIGAVAGALSLNGILWLLDQFDRPLEETEFGEEQGDPKEEAQSNEQ
jgi:hypothetical protein